MPSKKISADITDLAHALGLLVRRLRAVSGSQGLSWTEAIILKRLSKQGPATAAELARELGVTPQSMGSTVAALEKSGLVERKADAKDGRRVNVAASAKGAQAHSSVVDARRLWLAQAVSRLSEAEQRHLFAASALMTRLAQA
jgi:DNA-binding MarR family transcriptional regulator